MIEIGDKKYYDIFANIWETSVKSTHDFLKEEDFNFYRSKLKSEYFPNVILYSYKNNDGRIIAFMGVDGDKLEMLFIDDDFRGKGIGKELLTFAVNNLGIKKVDVNEQNANALHFYKKFGFTETGRQSYDPYGKSYPIINMELP